MRPTILAASFGTLLLLAAGACADNPDSGKPAPPKPAAPATPPKPATPAAAPAAAVEPERVTIQHVLIGFQGSVPGKGITRTQEEAKALAQQVLERAKKGEDFDALVKQYTDDSAPGIYTLVNRGVTPAQGEWPRGRMVAAFGDTGFPLKVGEIGMADYDPLRSPFGWHVIKRLK